MNSYPSPGDALPRMLRKMRDDIKQLKLRYTSLLRRIKALEDRVDELEGP